jgi:hypothetical protein
MSSIAFAISALLGLLDKLAGLFRDKQLRDEGRKDAVLESLQREKADIQDAARIADHVSGLSGDELDRLLRATSPKK